MSLLRTRPMLFYERLSMCANIVSESRPARKDYNKLAGEENNANTTNKSTRLDNDPVCRDDDESPGGNDSDPTFTDIEIDDQEDFSDDSDYG